MLLLWASRLVPLQGLVSRGECLRPGLLVLAAGDSWHFPISHLLNINCGRESCSPQFPRNFWNWDRDRGGPWTFWQLCNNVEFLCVWSLIQSSYFLSFPVNLLRESESLTNLMSGPLTCVSFSCITIMTLAYSQLLDLAAFKKGFICHPATLVCWNLALWSHPVVLSHHSSCLCVVTG